MNTVQDAALNQIGLILADGAAYPFKGRFANLTGGIDDNTGSFKAVAQFPNPKALLLPGMTGRVRYSTGVTVRLIPYSFRARPCSKPRARRPSTS